MSQKGRWARTDVCRRASFLWITEPNRLPIQVPCHESRGLGTAAQAQASVAEPVQHGMHRWTGDVLSIDCSLPTSDHEDEPSETSGLHSGVRTHVHERNNPEERHFGPTRSAARGGRGQGCPARSGVRKKPLAAQERRHGKGATRTGPRPLAPRPLATIYPFRPEWMACRERRRAAPGGFT